jgi:hypothetical protein
MILEPKHKTSKTNIKLKSELKKLNLRHHMSIPRAFQLYYFKVILNWWHSPFKVTGLILFKIQD